MPQKQKLDKGICRHLGTAEDPFAHSEEPSEEHRCYLWMQRDRIDLDFQKAYCISENHSSCPWLSISTPTGAIAERALFRVQSVILFLAAALWNGLQQLWQFIRNQAWPTISYTLRVRVGPFIWRGLGFVLRWIDSSARRMISWIARALRLRPKHAMVRDKSEVLPAPGATNDAAILIRLGKDASLRGDKKTAHQFFASAAKVEPTNEEIWLWKAATTADSTEAALSLKKALVLNPASGRAKAALSALEDEEGEEGYPTPVLASGPQGQPQPQTVQNIDRTLPEHALLEQGISALQEDREEAARGFFVVATEVHPNSQEAWFWRAKTAAENLPDVINYLEKALTINPDNEKVRAALDISVQRYEQEKKRMEQRAARQRSQAKASKKGRWKRASKVMLYVGGTACLALGLLWLAAGALPVLESTIGGDFSQQTAEYRDSRILPTLRFDPSVTGDTQAVDEFLISDLGFYDSIDFFPDFNLFGAIPVLLGIIFLLISDGLFSRQRVSAFWILIAVVGAVACLFRYLPNQETLTTLGWLPTPATWSWWGLTVIALSVIAVLGAFLGWSRLDAPTREPYPMR